MRDKRLITVLLGLPNARVNLFTYTEQFDNAAWSKTNSTVSANAASGPTGATTAEKLITNNAVADGRAHQILTLPVAMHTMSVYAKAGEWLAVGMGQAGIGALFNLSTGVVGTVFATYSNPRITAVGNGWYRCSISYMGTGSAGTQRVYASNSTSALSTGDGTSGIYIWGADLRLASQDKLPYQRVVDAATFAWVWV